MAGRVQGLVVARVNFTLSREAREKVESAVSALRVAAAPGRPAEEPVPIEAGRITVTSTVSGSVQMTR